MIQFNLLPDVKLQYIKTQHTKRFVVIISLVAAAVSLALLVVTFLSVQIAQKKHITDLNKDIKSQISTLDKVEDLDKILTIQNQLNSLPSLHKGKPVTSRIFGYISQVTPATASISNFSVDFTASTVNITGSADTLTTVNKFADTLKFATFTSAETKTGKPFTNVVTTLSLDAKRTSYVIVASFDPVLFESDDTPTLVVPSIISTRSETEKPAIFKEKEEVTK